MIEKSRKAYLREDVQPIGYFLRYQVQQHVCEESHQQSSQSLDVPAYSRRSGCVYKVLYKHRQAYLVLTPAYKYNPHRNKAGLDKDRHFAEPSAETVEDYCAHEVEYHIEYEVDQPVMKVVQTMHKHEAVYPFFFFLYGSVHEHRQ